MIDGQDIDTDTRVAMNQPVGIADPEVPPVFVMSALLETTTSNQHQSVIAETTTIIMQSSVVTVGAPTATEVYLLPSSSLNTSPPLQTTLPSRTAEEFFAPPLPTSNTPSSPLDSQPQYPTQITAVEQQPISKQQLLSHVFEDLISSQSSSTQRTAQQISSQQPSFTAGEQQHDEIGEQGTIHDGADAILQQWDNVEMCKSNMLSFNFDTSLLRDESKLSVIFKSLPEYADVKAAIEIEYQGESVEGIFCTENYQHVRGQQINDINQFRQMQGLVYYVRQLSTIEDEEERASAIVLCWADDSASTSQIFLERISFTEYIRLMEDGYAKYYLSFTTIIL
jgi:hypothetical protein